ncbi:putative diguanylate cyclase YcdT [compost metagenome]
MDLEQAYLLAERLREGISTLDFPLEGMGVIHVTASLGLAAAEPSMKSVEELINLADGALYRAKEGGRNRVETEEPAPRRQTGSSF